MMIKTFDRAKETVESELSLSMMINTVHRTMHVQDHYQTINVQLCTLFIDAMLLKFTHPQEIRVKKEKLNEFHKRIRS